MLYLIGTLHHNAFLSELHFELSLTHLLYCKDNITLGCVHYYYDNTSWDLIKFEPEPKSWVRYRELRDFLEALPFNQMAADNEYVERRFCLAFPGEAYLVYLPDGGDTSIDLSDVNDGSRLSMEWMAVLTGERKNGQIEKSGVWSGFNTDLANPFDDTDQPCVVKLLIEEE